ncbi:hypothetical protein QQF64_023242 [Cirrhinus molitorella]|uniref:Uncharacterized protein n=1 Tax=Cirrhinus molitorella TaxID=172907 RepID=A0ABR3L4N9_9TELE
MNNIIILIWALLCCIQGSSGQITVTQTPAVQTTEQGKTVVMRCTASTPLTGCSPTPCLSCRTEQNLHHRTRQNNNNEQHHLHLGIAVLYTRLIDLVSPVKNKPHLSIIKTVDIKHLQLQLQFERMPSSLKSVLLIFVEISQQCLAFTATADRG